MRGDLGITYDQDVLRLIDAFDAAQMKVGSVVITQWTNQRHAQLFRRKLRSQGVKVYLHYWIEGYPSNVDLVVSDKGFGKTTSSKPPAPWCW